MDDVFSTEMIKIDSKVKRKQKKLYTIFMESFYLTQIKLAVQLLSSNLALLFNNLFVPELLNFNRVLL